MATPRSADSRAAYRLSAMLSVAHACFERKKEREREREREKEIAADAMDEAVCCYRYRWLSKGSWYHYTCHSLRKPPRATKQYIKRHALLVLTFFSGRVIGFLSTGSPKNITFASQIFYSEKFLNLWGTYLPYLRSKKTECFIITGLVSTIKEFCI